MNALHQELIRLGNRILSLSRNELYLSMRFLDLALSALSFDLSLKTRTIATDGVHLFYNANYLAAAYQDDPIGVNRTYLHIILHGMFRHITGRGARDEEDWNLACDIAAESILDSMEYPCVHRPVSDKRQRSYDMLALPVCNAERIYDTLRDMPDAIRRDMQREFLSDDHRFWSELEDSDRPSPSERGTSDDPAPPDRADVAQNWQDISQKTQLSMETFHRERNLMAGSLLQRLHIENRARCDYRAFLQKFAVPREGVHVDPDSFDYGFYNYGLRLYKNVPLIEELEYREVKKIRDFVIAVDTSGSCSGELVRRFLEQAAHILLDSGSFFRAVNVHLVQCDAGVQSDIKLTDTSQLREQIRTFDVRGSGDTDFRPVFDYVDSLVRRGELTHVQGLLFFTDGVGVFPEKRPPYKTAFVFLDDNYTDRLVPPWAIKLVVGTDELKKR